MSRARQLVKYAKEWVEKMTNLCNCKCQCYEARRTLKTKRTKRESGPINYGPKSFGPYIFWIMLEWFVFLSWSYQLSSWVQCFALLNENK